eukprot:COSAG02_NODE_47622_length_340_cov_0.551867_1_plen_21_part_01
MVYGNRHRLEFTKYASGVVAI